MDVAAFGPARFEGRVPYMYLDTAGNVTVGIGHMLATAGAAGRLPFCRQQAGAPAATGEILDAWQKVKACPFGQSIAASRFNPARPPAGWPALPALFLEEDAIDSLFEADMKEHARQLERSLPAFPSLPEPAQEVLLDMHFNLGDSGFSRTRWPKLFAAVEARNWLAASRQCRRQGIQPARNDWAHETLAGLATAGTAV